MRRAKPEKREILPDIRYNSVTIQTMIHHMLQQRFPLHGKHGLRQLLRQRSHPLPFARSQHDRLRHHTLQAFSRTIGCPTLHENAS